MLKILGRKRVTVLAILFGLVVLTTGATFQFLIPAREDVENNLSRANSELESKRAEIGRLKKEMVSLKKQITAFKEIEGSGFFNDQNRVLAQETLDEMRAMSGVMKADYSVLAGTEVKNDQADSINHRVLKSPVEIRIESIDDGDFFNFLKLVLEHFPGRSNIMTMDLKKELPLNQENLKLIGAGKPVGLIKSTIKFDWYSMAKKTDPVPAASADPNAPPTDSAAVAAGAPAPAPANPPSSGGGAW